MGGIKEARDPKLQNSDRGIEILYQQISQGKNFCQHLGKRILFHAHLKPPSCHSNPQTMPPNLFSSLHQTCNFLQSIPNMQCHIPVSKTLGLRNANVCGERKKKELAAPLTPVYMYIKTLEWLVSHGLCWWKNVECNFLQWWHLFLLMQTYVSTS